jgi:hypothetical protein
VCSHASLIVGGQFFLQSAGIRQNRIEDAALALQPSFLALTEQAVEEPAGDHLRRQGALAVQPSSCFAACEIELT